LICLILLFVPIAKGKSSARGRSAVMAGSLLLPGASVRFRAAVAVVLDSGIFGCGSMVVALATVLPIVGMFGSRPMLAAVAMVLDSGIFGCRPMVVALATVLPIVGMFGCGPILAAVTVVLYSGIFRPMSMLTAVAVVLASGMLGCRPMLGCGVRLARTGSLALD
jgi:hypothetical protein